jgi:hypothetical protein
MAQFELAPDRLRVLRAVHAHGSSVCAGTCEHHLPNDFRCHNLGYEAKVSSNGAKRRLAELTDLGLLTRAVVAREEDKVVARYTLTLEGLRLVLGG